MLVYCTGQLLSLRKKLMTRMAGRQEVFLLPFRNGFPYTITVGIVKSSTEEPVEGI
jgi:hypothetical protein